MKFKEIFYLLGLKPRLKIYGHAPEEQEIDGLGRIVFSHWLHPKEPRRQFHRREIDELRKVLREGDFVIDIGAKTGDTTVALALAVGASGKVLALEPNPHVFPVLQQNAANNPQLTNIEPLPVAATETDGKYTFEYSDAGFGNGGLHKGISSWRHAHAFKLEVQGVNLAQLLQRQYAQDLQRLRLIKIDAEGYDYWVAKSLQPVLEQQRPYVILEVFKHVSQETRAQIFALFNGLGYRILKNNSLDTVVKMNSFEDLFGEEILTADDMLKQRHFDIICIPPGEPMPS